MTREDGWDDGEIDAFDCATADQSVTSEVRARAMRPARADIKRHLTTMEAEA